MNSDSVKVLRGFVLGIVLGLLGWLVIGLAVAKVVGRL